MQETRSLVFGLVSARLTRRAPVARPGGTATLPENASGVLCCLLTQAGQLVTKEALLQTVWPETVVSESALTVAIRHLRRCWAIGHVRHSLSRPKAQWRGRAGAEVFQPIGIFHVPMMHTHGSGWGLAFHLAHGLHLTIDDIAKGKWQGSQRLVGPLSDHIAAWTARSA